MSVLGLDVSKYDVRYTRDSRGNILQIQDIWNPDRATLPIDFVIQRASYGGREDEMLDILYKQVRKINVVGFYHYFSTALKYTKQMDVFMDAVDDKDFDFLVVDYEKYYNNLNQTSFAEVCEMVKQLKKLVMKPVLIYFNSDVYNTKMKPYGFDRVISDYDIWFAQYPYYTPVHSMFPNIWEETLKKGPSGWKNNWVFWQFSAGDSFAKSPKQGVQYGSHRSGIDTNIYNGSKESLYAWLGKDETTSNNDEQNNPKDNLVNLVFGDRVIDITIPKLFILRTNMNVRNTPSIYGEVVSSLPKGISVPILDVEMENNNYWGKISENKWVALFHRGVNYTNW